jgi:hypothetical protein
MQSVTFGTQQVNRPDANLQMLRNGPFVKAVRLTRQFNFTV